MYRDKQFRVRPIADTLEDVATAGRAYGDGVRKVFVMDGDALAMDIDHWEEILTALNETFPNLRRVSWSTDLCAPDLSPSCGLVGYKLL